MRFALLGNHPDGVEMANALVQAGHSLLACTALVDDETMRRWGDGVRKVSDIEEILADPAVDMVIVAGVMSVRAAQLRRALQSERPVLCVHPPDQSAEAAYEAAMIQADTGSLLLPLLPEATHPGIERLAQLLHDPQSSAALGTIRLIELERSSPGELLDGIEVPGQKPAIPGWDILRRLGGEIVEVSAFAAAEEPEAGQPLLLAGRFQQGCLFQMTLLPDRPQASWRLMVHGSAGQAELYWPLGWLGPAYLSSSDAEGEPHEEAFPAWDPWPVLIARLEEALQQGGKDAFPRWQDSVRALELDDAARRSLQRRRTSPLEYPDASEEVGFKGTMTLAGCGMVWLMLLLLIVSRWVPDTYRPLMGWLIVLMLVFFLGGQLLRYLLPRKPQRTPTSENE